MLLISLSVECLRLFDDIQTVDINYIDGLAYIKTLRKATMVGIEESEDILLRPLIRFIDLDAMLDEL